MTSLVRIGLIGCGRIAEMAHLPAYRTTRKAQLVAVADSDGKRARVLADKFRVEAHFSDPMKIMEDKSIDAVDICLPTFLHAHFITMALDSQKHVICEKPMGFSVEDADAIVAKVQKTGLKLMVGFNHRFEPSYKRFRDIMESRLLGDPVYMEFKYAKYGEPERYKPPSWRADPTKGGGVLTDFASHKIDMMRWLGGKISKVSALASHHLGTDAEDTAQLMMGFDNGCLGALSVSLVTPAPVRELDSAQIYGDNGAVRYSSEHKNEIEVYVKGRLLGRTVGFTVFQTSGPDSYISEIEAFIDSIVDDKEPPITAREARDVLTLIEAARESIRRNVAVNVALP